MGFVGEKSVSKLDTTLCPWCYLCLTRGMYVVNHVGKYKIRLGVSLLLPVSSIYRPAVRAQCFVPNQSRQG